tara:strand:- start:459 stop:734 length:276 start_codon:yes stop_codon:yes gene_type:complete
MTDYTDKQGFTLTRISSEAAMETPPRHFFDRDGITAYESLVPNTHREARRIFYVSGKNGDEFGQFPTEVEAKEQARFIADLPANERSQYEQ